MGSDRRGPPMPVGGVFLSRQYSQIGIQKLNINCKCMADSSGLLVVNSYI